MAQTSFYIKLIWTIGSDCKRVAQMVFILFLEKTRFEVRLMFDLVTAL